MVGDEGGGRGTDVMARQAPRKAAADDASGLRRHVKMGRAVQKGDGGVGMCVRVRVCVRVCVCVVEEAVMYCAMDGSERR